MYLEIISEGCFDSSRGHHDLAIFRGLHKNCESRKAKTFEIKKRNIMLKW